VELGVAWKRSTESVVLTDFVTKTERKLCVIWAFVVKMVV